MKGVARSPEIVTKEKKSILELELSSDILIIEIFIKQFL